MFFHSTDHGKQAAWKWLSQTKVEMSAPWVTLHGVETVVGHSTVFVYNSKEMLTET